MANTPKPLPSKPKGIRFVLRPYRRIPTQARSLLSQREYVWERVL